MYGHAIAVLNIKVSIYHEYKVRKTQSNKVKQEKSFKI